MTNREIFVIDGEDNKKEQSSVRKDRRMAHKFGNSNSMYWNGLHVFTILCCCGLAMSILTLIPRHNPFHDQSYWFEFSFVAANTYFIGTVGIVLDFVVLFEMRSLVTIRFFLKNYLATFLTWILSFCTGYMIWTLILDYNYPIPVNGALFHWPAKIVSLVSLLLILPRELSLEEESKKKLRNFVWYELGFQLANINRSLLTTVFVKLENTDAQFVFALLVPIFKKVSIFLSSKVMNGIVGRNNERANFNLATHFNFYFGLFVAVCLVGARPVTVACMVMVDAIMQLIMTYQIIKLQKKVEVHENETSKKENRKVILRLALAELCEGLVPLAYAISFSMAYYGPNAELIGNVKNDYWRFRIVEDIRPLFLVMSVLFSIDIVSFALNSIILWMCCKVNLLKEICSVLQQYWYILAVKLVNDVWWNFYASDINLANDMTFQFGWIVNDKNNSFT